MRQPSMQSGSAREQRKAAGSSAGEQGRAGEQGGVQGRAGQGSRARQQGRGVGKNNFANGRRGADNRQRIPIKPAEAG